MRSLMYLRPGNLYKDFIVETNTVSLGTTGRPQIGYEDSKVEILKGILAEANDRQRFRWDQLQHPITHTIVQDGPQMAKAEDKLVLGGRIFLIKGVEDPGSIGICTMYFVEERTDVR